ncbi:MAG: NUDIX domain-containing protein [Phycisphaerales bacterium]|jgi:8-oxo-dGTP diphosphatase|nr:NUDIX domain-containing protein [Phycisphaerales bacterium]
MTQGAPHPTHAPDGTLPYKLACLCDLRDEHGRVLLLRRKRAPNQGLCSPIGGKLDMATGESPAQCAVREIKEEVGLDIPIERLHLGGLISEKAFEGRGHWLLFYYRVLGSVHVEPHEMNEGWLEWHEPSAIDALPLPETDRKIIWPMIREHEARGASTAPGFFTLHIDCSHGDVRWSVEGRMPAR